MPFKIGEKQKKAVKMLWNGYKVHEIAATLGVHRATLWRWWQHPDMRAYAEKYTTTQARRIINKAFGEELSARLESPDPWERNEAAGRILDIMTDWLTGG